MNLQSIKNLHEIVKIHNFSLKVINDSTSELVHTEITLANQKWHIYIDDEYRLINTSKPTLCLYLVLRSLEEYADSSDFLDWSNQYPFTKNDSHYINYYRNLEKTYHEIKQVVGSVNSFISDLDYQLFSGEFSELLALNI